MKKELHPAQDPRERRKGIGASEAAAVCGFDPYTTARELYHIKRGEIEAEDLSGVAHIEAGNIFEDAIAQMYCQITGERVQRVNQAKIHPHYPFLRCNPDRKIVGKQKWLEVKNTNPFTFNALDWGETGTDEIPVHILFQCQHTLCVTGYRVMDVAVHLGSGDVRIYTIDRNDKFIYNMMEFEIKVWRMVENGVVPEMDYRHSSSSSLVAKLYSGTNGKAYEGTDEDLAVSEELIRVKGQIKELEAKKNELMTRLKSAAGESAVLVLPDGSGYTRSEVNRKGYAVMPTTYMNFLFTNKASQKASTLEIVGEATEVHDNE